jgi:ABC-type proline/glycine betaine transport system permease subunit
VVVIYLQLFVMVWLLVVFIGFMIDLTIQVIQVKRLNSPKFIIEAFCRTLPLLGVFALASLMGWL